MDFSNIFNVKEGSDLVALIDEDIVYLHKAFLFSKSSVLKNMFLDCIGSEVDFSVHPFKACLKSLFRFLYSGQLQVDDALLGACLEAVHFFEIRFLSIHSGLHKTDHLVMVESC